jgi:hypothetical protein
MGQNSKNPKLFISVQNISKPWLMTKVRGILLYIYTYIYINWDYNDYKNQGNPDRNQALGPPCFGQKAIGGDLAAEPQRRGFCHQPLHTTVPCREWDGGWASEKMGET